MKLLDERGIGTVWSICKEKFALVGHTHNYAGSGSPGGSANSAIGVVDYNQTGKTIQIGYSGTGITGDQIKYIAGYTDGSGNVNAKIKDVSKDALKSWLGLGSLAYSSSSIPTKLSQLTNDKGFVAGSVSGNTVTINGASTTWTNTWRGIQDNLTSSSTSDSLSANQGRVLKGLIDSKADFSDLSSYAQKYQALKFVKFNTIKNGKQYLRTEYADGTTLLSNYMENASPDIDGCMSKEDKAKLDGIASGANYYTLPTASETTLGGIKVSKNAAGTGWPICVNGNGLAQTKINGLTQSKANSVTSLFVADEDDHSVEYKYNGIDVGFSDGIFTHIDFPSISGTFALTSDIPDISKLCKFNFINSINNCSSNRINFLLRYSGALIDLDPFDVCPDGTILIISVSSNSVTVKHQSGSWFFEGDEVNKDWTARIYKEALKLITIYEGKVHYYSL